MCFVFVSVRARAAALVGSLFILIFASITLCVFLDFAAITQRKKKRESDRGKQRLARIFAELHRAVSERG